MFGRIEESALEQIENNKKTMHLITIKNIRYITLDDCIKIVEDKYFTGSTSFFVRHIRQIESLKTDPALNHP